MEKLILKYLRSPENYCGEVPAWLPAAGLCGYIAGYMGFFVYLRLGSSVFPGFFSFAALMLLMIACETVFSALVHIFLSLTGKKGNVSSVFYVSGLSCYLLTLALPIGLLSFVSQAAAGLSVLLLCLAMFICRIKLIRKVYADLSAGLAFLSMLIPGLLLQSILYLSLVYGIVNGIWLVKMSV